MNKIWRALAVIFVVYVAVMTVFAVQYFFDRGDMKKAARVIYEFKPSGSLGPTLVEQMANVWHVTAADVFCETEFISRYEGHVLIECGLKKTFEQGNRERNYHWLVDVVDGHVVAQNNLSKELLHEVRP